MHAFVLLLLMLPNDAEELARQRLAQARARQEMQRLVFALPREGRETLGTWARETPERERTIRTWLHSLPRFDDPRRFPDGRVAVDLVLTPEELVEQFDLPDKWAGERSLLWSTGQAGVDDQPRTAAQPSWEAVQQQGVSLATRVARARAIEILSRQLGPVALEPGESLGELLEARFAWTRFRAELDQRVTFEPTPRPSQLMEVAVTLAPEALPEAIRAALQQPELDLRRLALQDLGARLSATSWAAPTRDALDRDRVTPPGPEWSQRVLRVSVPAPADEEPSGQLIALRNAATPLLLEKILRLRVGEERTIADVARDHADLQGALQVAAGGGRVVARKPVGEAVQVDLPLRSVWKVVEPLVRD